MVYIRILVKIIFVRYWDDFNGKRISRRVNCQKRLITLNRPDHRHWYLKIPSCLRDVNGFIIFFFFITNSNSIKPLRRVTSARSLLSSHAQHDCFFFYHFNLHTKCSLYHIVSKHVIHTVNIINSLDKKMSQSYIHLLQMYLLYKLLVLKRNKIFPFIYNIFTNIRVGLVCIGLFYSAYRLQLSTEIIPIVRSKLKSLPSVNSYIIHSPVELFIINRYIIYNMCNMVIQWLLYNIILFTMFKSRFKIIITLNIK